MTCFKFFSESNIDKGSVYEIVFVGDSTCIPVSSNFNCTESNKSTNTDETIAYDATVLAAWSHLTLTLTVS